MLQISSSKEIKLKINAPPWRERERERERERGVDGEISQFLEIR